MHPRRSTHSRIGFARGASRGRRAKTGGPARHSSHAPRDERPGAKAADGSRTRGQSGPAAVFEVQYWAGSGWVTMPGAVTVNGDKVLLNLAAPRLATKRIRVLVHDSRRGRSHAIELDSY
jgi:hypothetical protein